MVASLTLAFVTGAKGQTTVYWDTNGNTAGAGVTPTGNWRTTTANWNTSATGTGGTLAGWTANNHAVFSAGTDGTGSFTATLNAGLSVGNITFEEGTALITGSTLTLTGAGGSTVNVATVSATINSILAGTAALNKSGTGILTLGANNTYSGGTTLNAGTLRVSADARLGATPGAATPNNIVISGGTLETTANFTLNANRGVTVNSGGGTLDVNNGTTLTYNGILAGTGVINKNDTGTLVLGGTTTNTHNTGAVNINAGTLQINKTGGADRALGNTSAVTVAAGATLNFTGGQSETVGSIAGAGTINSTNGTPITLTTGGDNSSTVFSGRIMDPGGQLGMVKTGTGTLTLSGTAANTFEDSLDIQNGTVALAKTAGVDAFAGTAINIGDGIGAANSAALTFSSSNQIIDSAAVVVATDGRFDLNGFTETIASLAGTGGTMDLGVGSLTTAGNASTTFAGILTGDGTFTKQGTGTFTLSSTTDYNFDGTFNLASGTLRLSDLALTLGTLNITGNSTIDFAGISSLNVTNFSISGGVTLTIQNWTDASDYFFAQNWTGAVFDTSGAAPMNQVIFASFAASNTMWKSYDSQITPVPEPSTYGAMFLAIATGLMFWRRSRITRQPVGTAILPTALR